jgi:hypothetical protein
MTRFFVTAVLSLALVGVAAPSQAQHRSRGGGGGGAAGSRAGGGGGGAAVPRGSVAGPRGGVVVGPRGGFGRPYYYGRPYYPGFSLGFYAGYPYYYPYYYPYGYYGAYGAYGAYPYAYPPYGGGYTVAAGGGLYEYGRVRIVDAPEKAPVFADGYYVGTVDDFNGTFQHLDLEQGAHQIEIRPQGQPVISFEVNVQPGETITYHAR